MKNGIPLYIVGAIVIFLIWRQFFAAKVAPGTVFGRVPGVNLPGLFVVNADKGQAGPQSSGVATVAPGVTQFQSGLGDTPNGSR